MLNKLKKYLSKLQEIKDFVFYPAPFFKSRSKIYRQKKRKMVNIACWPIREVYAEGSREKTAVISPKNINKKFDFLIPGHRYLFKQSNRRHKYQFWMEIIAYRIGKRLGLNICPTFFAKDSSKNINGSLSEWAYDNGENYVSGGNLISILIPNYDAEKGRQHNFLHIARLNRVFPGLIKDVINMLVFDCIIGNTDRHHSNWGIIFVHYRSWLRFLEIENKIYQNKFYLRILDKIYHNMEKILDRVLKNYKKYFSPLFDNGTSLGYEILEQNFGNINIEAYIKRGKHHMKYELTKENENTLLGEYHFDMIKKLYEKYPEHVEDILKKVFKLRLKSLKKELLQLTKIKTYEGYELTEERVEFILKLIDARIKFLKQWYEHERNSK